MNKTLVRRLPATMALLAACTFATPASAQQTWVDCRPARAISMSLASPSAPAEFVFEASCELKEAPSGGSYPYVFAGGDVRTAGVARYSGAVATLELTINMSGEKSVVAFRMDRCARDPFIAWESGAERCDGRPRLVAANVAAGLQGRTFFWGLPGLGRLFPLLAGEGDISRHTRKERK